MTLSESFNLLAGSTLRVAYGENVLQLTTPENELNVLSESDLALEVVVYTTSDAPRMIIAKEYEGETNVVLYIENNYIVDLNEQGKQDENDQ